MKLGTDVAASEFFQDGKYNLGWKDSAADDSQKKTSAEMISYYKAEWIDKYPFVSIEDPFDQDDWDAYTQFTAASPTWR